MTGTEFSPLAGLAGGALIGLAAVLLMATTGRIAGVSGYVARLLPPYLDSLFTTRLAFVAGLILAPLLYSTVTGVSVVHDITSNKLALIVGGLLVGLGTVIGGGCTSGHGVCGMARLSQRSLAATAIFMTAGIVTAFIMRHVLGG
jgi:uncharacterized protein